MQIPLKRSTVVKLSKIALALYWLAIFTGTHLPPSSIIIAAETNDKVEHFTAYMLLACLLAITWELASGVLTSRHLWLVWFAALAYGAFDEITQIPVHRDCDIWDWTADALGAATGILLFVALRHGVGRKIRYAE